MFQKLEQNYGKSNVGYTDPIVYYGNYESDKRFEIVISHSFVQVIKWFWVQFGINKHE